MSRYMYRYVHVTLYVCVFVTITWPPNNLLYKYKLIQLIGSCMYNVQYHCMYYSQLPFIVLHVTHSYIKQKHIN